MDQKIFINYNFMIISGDLYKIFYAKDLISENIGQSFVQSPKAILIDSKIRIYYTVRCISASGFPESNIYFSEFTIDFELLMINESNPILKLGNLGEFNEHGNAYFFPFIDGSVYYGLFSGLSRRDNTGIETAIGISISDNNMISFEKIGPGPLISTSINQPMLIGNPFLFKYNDLYYVYYIYGERWIENAELDGKHSRVYKIGIKKGHSLINLRETYNNVINDILGENECQATPCVFEKNGLFHMIFCYRNYNNFRNNKNKSYKLGYAFSNDLLNWKREDKKLKINFFGDWISEMNCYPSILNINNNIYLFCNGNEFGKHAFGIYKLNFL